MKKGKSRNRQARTDIMRRDAANARRKSRRQPARQFDRKNYDGHSSEGAGGQDRYH